MTEYFHQELTANGVLILTMDAPGQSANTMDDIFRDALRDITDELVGRRSGLTGIVFASAKRTFFAGGDLGFMMRSTREDAASVYQLLTDVKGHLRRIETLGIPVVAAINGAALGGGFEIGLASHYRIALDAPGTVVGLPEVTFGLLPGAGGVTRTVRMLGVQGALEKVLLRGQQHRPQDALALGLVDEIVSDEKDLIPHALTWIAAHPESSQPWDRPGYMIPGGDSKALSAEGVIAFLTPALRKQLKGSPAPAPINILSAAVEGAQVDFTTALDIESRYCTDLITGQISTNMIKANFFDMQQIRKGANRPSEVPSNTVQKLVVVGAGMMGSAIAFASARSGISVVLKDVTIEAAERGKSYAERSLAASVEKGAMTSEKAEAILARITPTADINDAAGSDFVVEAVFENPDLKKSVFRDLEHVVLPDALLGSNTSTLPITDLATATERPEDFIGLHFFSPADRLPLLEIIVGTKTGDVALAKALDFAKQIGKTPIVVNDGPGFFTTRVILQYVLEAIAAVGEGISAVSIEQAATQAGYPVGPLALVDELTLTLMKEIYDESAADRGISDADRHPGIAVIEKLISLDRLGRSKGAGFYSYEDGKKAGIWTGLADLYGTNEGELDFAALQERLLFSESIDAVRCLDEGILRSVADANVGSLLGIGFPGWTGGVLQYINQYAGGPQGFVQRAREFEKTFGGRFAPPESLVALAKAGGSYE